MTDGNESNKENEEKELKPEQKKTADKAKISPSLNGDDKQERLWCMLCHLSALINLIVWIPAVNILGPLTIWAWKKNEFPSIDREGKEAMNFQITLMIYAVIAFVLCFIFIGWLLLPVIYVGGIVLVIIASIKTNNGEKYSYPFTIRFIK